MSRPIALITGATSGIGKATAYLLASKYDLILCGRRKSLLKAIEKELSSITQVKVLSFDLSKSAELDDAWNGLEPNWTNIDLLINNAGNAHGLDPIELGKISDWDQMIDINIKGLLYISHKIIPSMVQRKKGHIINLGSIAGDDPYLKGNVYCASKSAVHTISETMRLDLNKYGIKVSTIKPGLVETNFSKVRFKGNIDKATKPYQGLKPLLAEDVANIIQYVTLTPDNVVITDLTVMPTAQASATIINRGN